MIEEYELKKQRIEKGGAERYHQKTKKKENYLSVIGSICC